MKVIISCLRRSGSTAIYKELSKLMEFATYDEPFNPLIARGWLANHKGTARNLCKLQQSSKEFNQLFAPIGIDEEASPRLSRKQGEYLSWLLESSENVLIDSTRLNFKIRHVTDKFPDVKYIYLYRDFRAFISSHILPNPSDLLVPFLKVTLSNAFKRRRFFSIRKNYNAWGYETLCSELFRDEEQCGLAVIRLYRLWEKAYNEHYELAKQDKVHMLSFERFCDDPATQIKNLFDESLPAAGCGQSLRSPNYGFEPSSPRWKLLCK